MTDPRTQPGQPSPEELRAYLEQLREADVSEILVQAYSMLATGAEVKLGRPDARAVIDVLAAMVDALAGGVDEKLAQQMRTGVSQLQVAQVQAEQQVAARGGATGSEQAEHPEDAGQQDGEEGAAGDAGGQQGAGERMTDRLWIPGRGPGTS